jgi:hypothetical protein
MGKRSHESAFGGTGAAGGGAKDPLDPSDPLGDSLGQGKAKKLRREKAKEKAKEKAREKARERAREKAKEQQATASPLIARSSPQLSRGRGGVSGEGAESGAHAHTQARPQGGRTSRTGTRAKKIRWADDKADGTLVMGTLSDLSLTFL